MAEPGSEFLIVCKFHFLKIKSDHGNTRKNKNKERRGSGQPGSYGEMC